MSDDAEYYDNTTASDYQSEDGDEVGQKKKGPGRPRKNVPSKKPERKGILLSPSNPDDRESDRNALELLYENPIMFKKIFSLFKAYAVEEINMFFDKDRVFMYSINPSGEIKILVEIFCCRMNEYYLDKQHHIVLGTEQFYKIFQGLTKDFSKVFMVTSVGAKHQKFWTVFTDEDDEESIYSVDLGTPESNPIGDINAILKMEHEYPISFELTFKYLKRKITEFGNIPVKKINIEQTINPDTGAYRLYLKCETQDHRIGNESPFRSLSKINLISTYEDSLFTAPIFISNIRPLANTLISDKIKFSVDEQKDLIFTADLDHDIDPETKKRIIGTEKCRIRVTASLAKTQVADL